MGALGHYLEAAGLATTSISLIRLHTEKIRPPRALWVSYELGRPLGRPNDPDLQRRILTAALALLEAPSGPVLADWPEPDDQPGAEMAAACPVSFPPPADAGPAQALAMEMSRLATWYELAKERHGRTTVGGSGFSLDQAVAVIEGCLEGRAMSPRPEMPPAVALKQASEELKAFYYEAALAQPGGERLGSQALGDWFWGATAAGRALLLLRRRLWDDPDPAVQETARRLLVPAAQARRQPD
ncbi:MAG: hypothetical protein V1797_11705 [Pseudomonadota bacterium]